MTKPTQSRELAYEILMEILEKGGYSHVVLRQALEKYQYLEKQDRALITRIAEGTVEYLLTIDAVIGRFSKVPVKKLKPAVRTILRMSVYQIFWMDRIPDRAVCSEAVKLAENHRFGSLKGFINGVLRAVVREKDSVSFEDWSLKYSMPRQLIDMWLEQYPKQVVEGMLQAFLADAPTAVRCNKHLTDISTIKESLESQGVKTEQSAVFSDTLLLSGYDYLESLTAFQKGWIQVQDPSSSLVCRAADPKPGSQVLDLCAAPGGKSLHMADLLGETGMVTARDVTEQKAAMIEENIRRTGFSNIQAQIWDARCFDPEWEEKADIVLADLPCSGLGIIGKKPDIKYQASLEKIRELAALQREILSVAARYVKPGGRLVYSTCTVSRLENEDQRAWFLEHFPEFQPGDLRGRLGEGLERDSLKDGYIQLLPGQDACDGFFITLFEKKL